MTKRGVSIAAGIIVLVAGIGLFAFVRFPLGAVEEPGRFEMRAATWAKHLLAQRASRSGIPPAPTDRQSSLVEGDKVFGVDCAACHGMDGRHPTDAGRWMYPRAADLGSKEVQSYSDRELFWIIKNGIRLSGMPAFAKVESDEHIWDLVLYLRTLPETGRRAPTKE
ncbi:MAG TPA: cytochrome c [Candidatus Acidoferrum sp.]